MKNLKFSRLFAALMFVAVLGLTGCKPEPEAPSNIPEGVQRFTDSDGIIGTWVSEC